MVENTIKHVYNGHVETEERAALSLLNGVDAINPVTYMGLTKCVHLDRCPLITTKPVYRMTECFENEQRCPLLTIYRLLQHKLKLGFHTDVNYISMDH